MTSKPEHVHLIIPIEAFHVNQFIPKDKFQVNILTKNNHGTYDQLIQTYDEMHPYEDSYIKLSMNKANEVNLSIKEIIEEVVPYKVENSVSLSNAKVYRAFEGYYKERTKSEYNLKDDTIFKYDSKIIIINLFEGTAKFNYNTVPLTGLSPTTLSFLARK